MNVTIVIIFFFVIVVIVIFTGPSNKTILLLLMGSVYASPEFLCYPIALKALSVILILRQSCETLPLQSLILLSAAKTWIFEQLSNSCYSFCTTHKQTDMVSPAQTTSTSNKDIITLLPFWHKSFLLVFEIINKSCFISLFMMTDAILIYWPIFYQIG